ncbi:MAG: HAD-IA family hydrolase, partial [Candidatus Marinimicrobia bacterium]|nr:HAD-IA family hydrolase [Candidatus Neomarinimicrobiota bacterium]
LLTNTNQRHVRNEIEKKYVFSQLADGTIYSFEEGARKPEKEIFNIAAEKIGADLNTCLFIDDKKENVTSAKSAGFLGLHYIDTQRLERDLGYLGVI